MSLVSQLQLGAIEYHPSESRLPRTPKMGLVPPLKGEKCKNLERTLGFYIKIFYTMSMLISIVNNARDKHADGL
jgi:hypothetical protein